MKNLHYGLLLYVVLLSIKVKVSQTYITTNTIQDFIIEKEPNEQKENNDIDKYAGQNSYPKFRKHRLKYLLHVPIPLHFPHENYHVSTNQITSKTSEITSTQRTTPRPKSTSNEVERKRNENTMSTYLNLNRTESPAIIILGYKPILPPILSGPVNYPEEIIRSTTISTSATKVQPSNLHNQESFSNQMSNVVTSPKTEYSTVQIMNNQPSIPSFISGPVNYPGEITRSTTSSNNDITTSSYSQVESSKITSGTTAEPIKSATSPKVETSSFHILTYKPIIPSFISGPVNYPMEITKTPIDSSSKGITTEKISSSTYHKMDPTNTLSTASPNTIKVTSPHSEPSPFQSLTHKPSLPSFISGPVNYPEEITRSTVTSPRTSTGSLSTYSPLMAFNTTSSTASEPSFIRTSPKNEIPALQILTYKPIIPSYLSGPVNYPEEITRSTTVSPSDDVTTVKITSSTNNQAEQSITTTDRKTRPITMRVTTHTTQIPAIQILTYKPILPSFISGPVNYPEEITRSTTESSRGTVTTVKITSPTYSTPRPITMRVTSSKTESSTYQQSPSQNPSIPSFISGPVNYPEEITRSTTNTPSTSKFQSSTYNLELNSSKSTVSRNKFPLTTVTTPKFDSSSIPTFNPSLVNNPGESTRSTTPRNHDIKITQPPLIKETTVKFPKTTIFNSHIQISIIAPEKPNIIEPALTLDYKPIRPSVISGPINYPEEIIRHTTIPTNLHN